ncbi:MAG: hypothetical protein ACLUEJ_09645 [Clostridium sp.]
MGRSRPRKPLKRTPQAAVATAEEALERGNGIKAGAGAGPGAGVPVWEHGGAGDPTAVFDLTRAERLSETAVSMGMTARVHIAVDTG